MASSMKTGQLEELKDTFALFDKNGDGKISESEMEEILTIIGVPPTFDNGARSEIKLLANKEDNKGMLKFDDFLTVMAKALRYSTNNMEELLEAFGLFDYNNGRFSAAELKKILCSDKDSPLKEEDIDDVLKQAGCNEGDFSYEELIKKLLY